MTDKIIVNQQSSIKITSAKTIYFDPFGITGAPHDADVIFITHEHYDHFSLEDISKAANGSTVYAAPKTMLTAMKKAGISENRTTFLEPGNTTEVCGITVEAVSAYNRLKPFHPRRNNWLGYVVTIEGKRLYICGDTDDTPEAEAVKCDIIFVPIGGTFTMNARSAAELVNAVKPEIAIPIHFGTLVGKKSDADTFEKLVSSSIKVIRKIPL